MAKSISSSNISLRSEASFADAKEWAKLAEKHITRFNLPSWEVPCTEIDMDLWTGRLDISQEELMDYLNTDCEDWMAFNPDWPLRAFIGLLLEFIDTRKAASPV